MPPKAAPFSPRLNNIPLANLRDEFAMTLLLFHTREFRYALASHVRPIRTPLLDWHDRVEPFLTLLVQRAILGLEAYIAGAVWTTLLERGLLTEETNAKVRDPFSIKGEGGTARKVYDRMPALIEPALGMATSDPDLFDDVRIFYRDVRNPLLHGMELSTNTMHDAYRCLLVVERVYQWIDAWQGPPPPASFVLMGTFPEA